jgi:hypothetical protein
MLVCLPLSGRVLGAWGFLPYLSAFSLSPIGKNYEPSKLLASQTCLTSCNATETMIKSTGMVDDDNIAYPSIYLLFYDFSIQISYIMSKFLSEPVSKAPDPS